MLVKRFSQHAIGVFLGIEKRVYVFGISFQNLLVNLSVLI